MIPNMFEEVKGFSNQTHIHEEEILFVDSMQENAKATSFSFGAFCFMVMMAVFVVAMLLSTVILMQRRKVAFESYQQRKRQQRVSPMTSPNDANGRIPNTAKVTQCEKLMRCFSISDNL